MKRFLSILLVAMLLVTCLATAAFAAGNASVSVGSVNNAVPGNEYTVTFTVSGEFANYELLIKSDSALTLTGISGITGNKNTGKVAYATDENVTSHSFKATFKLAEGAKCGSYKVYAEVLFVADRNLVKQTVSTSAGYITVSHNWGAWTQTKAPTCTEAGKETRTCAYCGETETRDVATLKHDYKLVETKKPTCGVAGLETYKCSNCGDTYTKELAALTHDHSKLVEDVPATCTVDGRKVFACVHCGDKITKVVKAPGHTACCSDYACDHDHYNNVQHWFICKVCGVSFNCENHDMKPITGGMQCKCGYTVWDESPEPDTGDYRLEMTVVAASAIALMAAAAYVFKRKFAK